MQYADVLPTIVDIVDTNTSANVDTRSRDAFDGTSFLPVLMSQTDVHRDYVFGSHNNVPEGSPYPIRTISDGQYRYIRNLLPDAIYLEKHVMGLRGNGKLNNRYWASWVWNASEDPRTYHLVRRYLRRPAEELYHTASDPFEMTNLAANSTLAAEKDLAKRKTTLSERLDQWMVEQGDPGQAQDTLESLNAARNAQHRFGNPQAMSKAERSQSRSDGSR